VPQIELIHKSKKYAHRIFAHIPLDPASESYVRTQVFDCWVEAYQAGLEAGLAMGPHREDMGK